VTHSSVLMPDKIKAQSNAAIAALQADNGSIRMAISAMYAFIDDNTTQSRRFNNLKQKMEDYVVVSNAFMQANNSDISDHRSLMSLVGDEDLVGSNILKQHAASTVSINLADKKIAYYTWLMNDITTWQNWNSFDWAYTNAKNSKNNWEALREIDRAIIRELEAKIDRYNTIEQRTRDLFTAGCDLRHSNARTDTDRRSDGRISELVQFGRAQRMAHGCNDYKRGLYIKPSCNKG